jgi:hypothetical protein
LSLDKIKDLISIVDFAHNQNPLINFVEGQFLTKRNSKEKWRERCLNRVPYGIRARDDGKTRESRLEDTGFGGEKGGNHRGQPKCAQCELRSFLVIGEVEKVNGVFSSYLCC